MTDSAVANNYYNAAKSKMKEGDYDAAISFLEKAAYEYIELSKEYKDSASGDFYNARKNECIRRIKELKTPKRISVGAEKEEKIKYEIEFPDKSFDDVAGMYDLKEKLYELIIIPLMRPDLAEYDLEQSSGTILYGPPGCGKTHIVTSIPGEIKKRTGEDVGIIDLSVSDILDQWVGSTEKHIKTIFETAEKNEPSIVFFDEMEAIGMSRSSNSSSYAHRFIDELLKDTSKIREKNKRVYIIGATNYPSLVDPALLRPGRFDDVILVKPPDFEARVELFKLYTNKLPHSKDIDYKELALVTEDFSGADIKKVCRDAGKSAKMKSIKENKKYPVKQEDLMEAINQTEPSVYFWYDDMERMIKRGKLNPIFAKEIEKLIEESKERRYGKNEGE